MNSGPETPEAVFICDRHLATRLGLSLKAHDL